jgi:hypothetical protein
MVDTIMSVLQDAAGQDSGKSLLLEWFHPMQQYPSESGA